MSAQLTWKTFKEESVFPSIYFNSAIPKSGETEPEVIPLVQELLSALQGLEGRTLCDVLWALQGGTSAPPGMSPHREPSITLKCLTSQVALRHPRHRMALGREEQRQEAMKAPRHWLPRGRSPPGNAVSIGCGSPCLLILLLAGHILPKRPTCTFPKEVNNLLMP